ncbi:MAG: tRNA pseudouridine(55) synthase TruB [Nitrospirota bacterium]
MDIVISINKPKGITSQDAVSKVKKILKVKKAGHTGTLDPMATGLLIVCVNRATRLASYFTGLDKEYMAVMKLGETTDTLDAEGSITSVSDPADIDKASISRVLKSFEGTIQQLPPMYSALKHKGKPLYKLAREGMEIERKPREVSIEYIKLLDTKLPYVTFSTRCSKGTYIRTLCDDIGRELGVGAHLYELERTEIGQYKIDNSLSLDELKSISQGEKIDKGIYTMYEALSWLPEFRISETMLKRIMHGNPVELNRRTVLSDDLKSASGIKIMSADGDLLAIGRFSEVKNIIKMNVVFS